MRRYRRNTALTYQQICQKWDRKIDEDDLRTLLGSKLRVLCQSEDIENFNSMFELLISFGDEALCEIFVEHSDGQIGLNLSLPCIKANVSYILFELYGHIYLRNSPIWQPLYAAGKMLAIDSMTHEDDPIQDLAIAPSLFRKVVKEFSQMVPIIPTNRMKPFYIGKYEVTQALWHSAFNGVKSIGEDSIDLIGDDPSHFKGWTRPVEQVSWYDCIIFCNHLSRLHGLKPVYHVNDKKEMKWDKKANGYRLLTEAEWEYAAKANTAYEYAGSDNVDEVAWYEGNSGDKTHGVGQLYPNNFGLYDMSGNVWEWCWNAFGSYIPPNRVYRGGSWLNDASYARVSRRGSYDASDRDGYRGFRLARNME